MLSGCMEHEVFLIIILKERGKGCHFTELADQSHVTILARTKSSYQDRMPEA
jgi:hypothetical protein